MSTQVFTVFSPTTYKLVVKGEHAKVPFNIMHADWEYDHNYYSNVYRSTKCATDDQVLSFLLRGETSPSFFTHIKTRLESLSCEYPGSPAPLVRGNPYFAQLNEAYPREVQGFFGRNEHNGLLNTYYSFADIKKVLSWYRSSAASGGYSLSLARLDALDQLISDWEDF